MGHLRAAPDPQSPDPENAVLWADFGGHARRLDAMRPANWAPPDSAAQVHELSPLLQGGATARDAAGRAQVLRQTRRNDPWWRFW
ncbi:hypothetical protein AIOL_001574 [Candidatus Rhodobacter oscarellae]|uniref:Uncharacterized protein n=1 Tax=Candidatus Rhodobacter oscarellae TaxID=1675527 RepID=A0A0J9E1N5_9RHOB|nr:hypothetical protein AIOL_001574 [Candidatus Rhodobacter lobularis]